MRLPDLDKPLHRFSESELFDLMYELQYDEWLRDEETIQEATRKFVQYWTETLNQPHMAPWSGHYIVSQPQYHGVGPDYIPAPTTPYKTVRITINIPQCIPPEYVPMFAEQMIREQIRPEED